MKRWLIQKVRRNEKIVSAALTVPIIAAGAMSGACAAGCPYGLVNDPYPGQCPRYIDVTGDGICDLSQAATTASTSSPTGPTNADTNNSATGTDDVSINGAGQDSGFNQNDSVNASTVDSGSGLNSFGDGSSYHVLPISILLIGGYLFTHMLFSRGILSQKKHRRLWNLLVTGGYIGTGITGILLTFMINLGVHTVLNPSITFWHAELAVLMVIGTLIHIHLYKKPFKKMFKVLLGFGKSSSNKKSENTNTSK